MKTKNISTGLKGLMTVALLTIAAVGAAQTPATPDSASHFQWQVGDTIIIDKNCTHYLTGERMSTWVYHVSHPILQVGTKRFPNGVLIKGILSWVDPSGLILKGAIARQDAAEQAAVDQRQTEQKQQVEARAEETENLSELQRLQIEQQASQYDQELLKADSVKREPEPQPAPAPKPTTETETDAVYTIDKDYQHTKNYQRFTLGIRGGYVNTLPTVAQEATRIGGFGAMLDLQYTYYWTKFGRPIDLGILTGLSIGYTQNAMNFGINDQYSVSTVDGPIDYTLTADKVAATDRTLQLEIPLLFALKTEKGLFFHVGPKLMLPVYTPYSQTITNPSIDAYFPEMGVHVTNEAITGRVEDGQLSTSGTNANQWKVNLFLTAEIGYEWNLHSGNAFSLGAYFDGGVFSAYKGAAASSSLIGITPPTATGAAVVDILPATNAYVTGLHYINVGLKLGFHFNYPKQNRTVTKR